MAEIKGGTKFMSELRVRTDKLSKASEVQVGFLPDKRYPDGTLTSMVAAIQEFGAPKAGIPPRPFFRNMISKEQKSWPQLLSVALQNADLDASKALSVVGEEVAGELRQSIVDTNEPALSPVTLMLRKMVGPNGRVTSYAQVKEARARVAAGESPGGVSSKPLVWTGQLLDSIDHIVK